MNRRRMNLVIDTGLKGTSPLYHCVPFDKGGLSRIQPRMYSGTRLEKATKGRVFGSVIACRRGKGVEGMAREEGDGAKKTVVMPRTTEIRRNFNISWRGCNPLDKRVPAPWCLLTNRGHRFSRRGFRTKQADVEEEKIQRSISRERGRIWIESKRFRRALSPKQIARSSRAWWVSPCPQAIIASVVLDEFVNAQRGKMAGTPGDPEKSSWFLFQTTKTMNEAVEVVVLESG